MDTRSRNSDSKGVSNVVRLGKQVSVVEDGSGGARGIDFRSKLDGPNRMVELMDFQAVLKGSTASSKSSISKEACELECSEMSNVKSPSNFLYYSPSKISSTCIAMILTDDQLLTLILKMIDVTRYVFSVDSIVSMNQLQ